MSRKVQLVLLCEDSQHEAFIRRFLKKRGWPIRHIRVEKAPASHGSGEQFVRERFPHELAIFRKTHVAQRLVVMIDGDAKGGVARLTELDGACKIQGVAARKKDEKVAVFVPTWNIETWLAYLDGKTVDETKKDYPRLARQRDCQRQVDVLNGMCSTDRLRYPTPSSLQVACEEFHARLA